MNKSVNKYFLPLTVLFFFGSMLITPLNMRAQEEGSGVKKFRFGLSGSSSIGWLKPDNENMNRNGVGLGLSYGLNGDILLSDNIAVNTGIDLPTYRGGVSFKFDTILIPYIDTSGNKQFTVLGGTSESKLRLKYVEIPFLLKMKTNEIGYITYFGLFGGRFGFNYSAVDGGEKSSTNGSTRRPYNSRDVKDNMNFFRACFSIGGGLEYSLSGTTALVGSITYNNGLSNVYKALGKDKPMTLNKDLSEGPPKKAFYNNVVLRVGILF